MIEPLDLGSGVTLRFVSWAPDRALNPQYADLPDVERYGAIISHEHVPCPGDDLGAGVDAKVTCEGYVTFDGEAQRRLDPDRPRWKVESWEPLTLSPSIQSPCGFHGFVRQGRWVPA